MDDLSFEPLTDNSKRVIYNILPSVFSKFHHDEGDDVFDSALLVEYWEQHYLTWGNALNVLLNFDGDYNVFSVSQLDSLAPFFGFTSEPNIEINFSEQLYNPDWSKQTKIDLFLGVYKDPFIWRFRGSEIVYYYVAKCLGIEAYITTDQGFIAGVNKAGDICGNGSEPGQIIIKYPAAYLDNSIERGYLDYLNTYFIPPHVHYTLQKLN